MAYEMFAVRLEAEVKAALRVRAITEGRTMRQTVNDALVSYLVTPAQYLHDAPPLSSDYPVRQADAPRRLIPRADYLRSSQP